MKKWTNLNLTGIVSIVLTLLLMVGLYTVGTKVNDLHRLSIELSFINSDYLNKFIDIQLENEENKEKQEQFKEYIKTQGEKNGASANLKEISQEDIAALHENAPVKGDPEANIVLVQYADFLCSFCKVLHDAGTIDAIIENNQDVSTITKMIPLFGERSEAGARAAYCVAKQGSTEEYNSFMEKAFERQATTNEETTSIIKEVGLDSNIFEECISASETKKEVAAYYPKGIELFSISGTPATVVVNKTTGAYTLVGGAVPKAQFENAIESVK